MTMFGMIGEIMFIPLIFILSIFLALAARKRIMRKTVFVEIDENLKDLGPREFFYNILKIERAANPIYCIEIFLLIVDTVYILFGGYLEYLKELEFVKEYPDFSISPITSVLIKFGIPIFLWFVILFLLLFALFMRKKENKRIFKMLDDLDEGNLLTYAKEDFINSDRIVGTGIMLQSDLKLGSRYLFCVYPAYIIPYSWIYDVKVDKFFSRGGNYYSLNFTLNKSFDSIQIFFAKKNIAEKARDFILEK